MDASGKRLSPVSDLAPRLALRHAGDLGETGGAALFIRDVSLAARIGCKGPGAAAWLAAAGILLPKAPNTWLPLADGGLVARLGLTEYLVEATADTLTPLRARPREPGVYPVLREDAALALGGPALPELLRQTCNVNFAALDLARRPVILTSMAGVGVTVIPGEFRGALCYRVWCDGTYGEYLTETLLDIAAELDAKHPNLP
jgi:sarcosine oxidase subunit gamma